MEKIDAIFFIGPQGSGKGTQARKLSERLGFFYWEMGGILREEATKDTAMGWKVKEQINAGVLLSDEFLLEVAKSRLDQIPLDKGIIFDGIPRRIGQAKYLLEYVKDQGRINLVTLFLDIPREDSLTRLLKRAEHENRVDDTKEKIEFRLDQYYNDTVPMLDIMREATYFITVDGTKAIEEVTDSIHKELGLE